MNENAEKKIPADPSQVNINPPEELRFWADKYHVCPQVIQDAVRKVGGRVGDVEKELNIAQTRPHG